MKSLRYFILSALLVALGVSTSSDSFAQRGPGHGKRPGDSTDIRPDSIRPPKDPRDTAFRGGRPDKPRRVHELIGYFIHNDSCREVLLSKMTPEDAAAFTALLGNLGGNGEQIKSLRQQLRAAREAGDTATFRAISEQLKTLYRQIGDNQKAIADLLQKYAEVAMQVQKDCGGRPPHKGRDGGARGGKGDKTDDGAEQQKSVISPNPVPVGGSAVLTLKLAVESNVGVTISDQSGVVLTIPAAQLAAGEQQIALNLSSLARGAYLVQVQIGDKMQVLKLMIM